MLLLLIDNLDAADNQLKMGRQLADGLKKTLGVLSYVATEACVAERSAAVRLWLDRAGLVDAHVVISDQKPSALAVDCERFEASFLLLQWDGKSGRHLKKLLTYCRDLRIPYLFCRPDFAPPTSYANVLVPVGFLPEEYEKTQFAVAFGRFFDAKITLLLANDYGSKARTTTAKMETVFDKFHLSYTRVKAHSDSFGLDREAVVKGEKEGFDFVLISASRDYGLDDLLFGAKEYRLVKKSPTPLLLINPRADLYALCD